jgi:hypothetical protein
VGEIERVVGLDGAAVGLLAVAGMDAEGRIFGCGARDDFGGLWRVGGAECVGLHQGLFERIGAMVGLKAHPTVFFRLRLQVF